MKGLPVTVEEAKEDVERVMSQHVGQNNDEFLAVIQTMGQAINKLANQDKSIKDLQNMEKEHKGQMKKTEERTEKVDETIEYLKHEIQLFKGDLAALREKKENQSVWSRLFKRNYNK